jgi:hypothetical protein
MRLSSTPRMLVVSLALSASIYAQQATAVPRLIRFNASYHTANQQTQPPVVGATFSIYREENDGTPLWSEVQNIRPDKDGNYTALLGATRSEGMPVDLFLTTEPRWLEVEIDQIKQPRVLLGSVPYAMKASDADTLGGLPASAYLRANPSTGSATTTTISSAVVATQSLSPLVSSGSPGCIGQFVNSTDLICAAINQSVFQGNPAVSVGSPTSYLGALTMVGNVASGDAAGMALYNAGGGGGASVSLDMYNTSFNGGIPQAKIKAIDDGAYSDHLTFWTKTPGGPGNAVTEKVRITSVGNVGIGTSTPGTKLEVNGSLMVDGNINISGAIFAGASGVPLFQSPTDNSQNFSAGTGALQSITPGGGGSSNTAIGYNALHVTTTSQENTAVGAQALAANTSGQQNTAVGWSAMASNTTAFFNTAVGSQALQSNTSGSSNVALGDQAMQGNTGGQSNVAVGDDALFGNTTGQQNTAVGTDALENATGSFNTVLGSGAMPQVAGNNNVALGVDAGLSLISGNNNVYIASNAGGSSESGVVRIGSGQSATFISGISGINVSGVPVQVSSSGQLGVATSSRRFKQDIEDMGDATANLMRLRPVTYHYKQPFEDGSQPIQYGLIAEEVEEVYPELVAHSADGQIETVKYQVLDSMLLNELQKQNATITAQKDEIQSLKERMARLESLLERTASAK